MLESRARVALAIAAVPLLGCGAAAATVGATGHRAATSIRSVTVGGSPARPIFTIRGAGLSVPAPDPRTSPSSTPLCPLKISGNAGRDYGTKFYVLAWDAQPAGDNKLRYAAGRYRPRLRELDCIGIVVLSEGPSRVTFTFGHAYSQYRAQYGLLRDGDVIEVVLNGAAFATVVRYP